MTRPEDIAGTARAVVIIAVDPMLTGMSRVADKLEAQPFLPGRRALHEAIESARQTASDEGGRPVIVVLPSNHPELVALAAARRVDRIALYHAASVHLGWLREVALRAAFALVDLTLVPDDDALREVILFGADPDRVARTDEPILGRIIAEPRRRDQGNATAEALASLALDAAEKVGALRIAEKLTPDRGVNVVNYHRILPIGELRTYGRPQMALAQPIFEAQLEDMRKLRGFTDVDRVLDPGAEGRVAITFDDGYEDNFRVALPILRRSSVPACIFVVTNLIGEPGALWWDRVGLSLFAYWRSGAKAPVPEALPVVARRLREVSSFEEVRSIISAVVDELNKIADGDREPIVRAAESLVPPIDAPRTMLSWEEIQEMQKNGVRFGAHTKNHVILDQVPPEVARAELFGSIEDLEKHLEDGAPKIAALPRGKRGALTDEEIRNAGIGTVMTTEAGVNKPSQEALYVLRRDGRMLTLRGRHHRAKLRLELTGLMDRVRGPTHYDDE